MTLNPGGHEDQKKTRWGFKTFAYVAGVITFLNAEKGHLDYLCRLKTNDFQVDLCLSYAYHLSSHATGETD